MNNEIKENDERIKELQSQNNNIMGQFKEKETTILITNEHKEILMADKMSTSERIQKLNNQIYIHETNILKLSEDIKKEKRDGA